MTTKFQVHFHECNLQPDEDSNEDIHVYVCIGTNVTGFGKTDHNVTFCISRNAVLKH